MAVLTWTVPPDVWGYTGDAREALAEIPASSVACAVTSPPYFGLRAYEVPDQVWGGLEACRHEWRVRPDGRTDRWRTETHCSTCGAWYGQLGLEFRVDHYVAHLVQVFAALRRVLRPDGTLWVNLGDSFTTHTGKTRGQFGRHNLEGHEILFGKYRPRPEMVGMGLVEKSLVGAPFRFALAMQRDGWILRQVIVWSKPTARPEPSVRDRPWTTHEYVFLFATSQRYRYYAPSGSSVWEIAPEGYPGYGTVMPRILIQRCLAAGSAAGDWVLDPFAGTGSIALAARALGGRKVIYIDASERYAQLARQRLGAHVAQRA